MVRTVSIGSRLATTQAWTPGNAASRRRVGGRMASAAASAPRGRVRTEPGAKRIRTFVAGVAVADTTRPLYVWENPHYPSYYVPAVDVRTDLLVRTSTVTHSPSRGDGTHFTVRVGDHERVDAAWQYGESPIEELRDHIRFDWD